jgi:hypothetical protein
MDAIQLWSLLGNVVTVLGLPFAIAVFIHEKRKQRENEEQEIYQLLSDDYTDFLKLVIANPDLKLRSRAATPDLSEEQHERTLAIFAILIALFERAYLLTFEDGMSGKKLRRWHSWEDFMREWCQRDDFRAHLPELLHGEDPDFAAQIRGLAAEEAATLSVLEGPEHRAG